MRFVLAIILLSYSCVYCNNKPADFNKDEQTDSESPSNTQKLLPYHEFKDNTLKEYRQPGKSYDSLHRWIYYKITEDMPAYWVGTAWDFNGTTRQPKQGFIACGYFVTTLLNDIGYTNKRIYLAQQPSSVMIKTLCTDIRRFRTTDDINKYLLGQKKFNVFIIGLDFHTGFLFVNNKTAYFFHSNYIKRQGVIIEPLLKSKAITSSKSFMIGRLK